MRNRRLYDALLAFAHEAAEQLATDTEVDRQRGFASFEFDRGGRAFHCYRPLTGGFIDEHRPLLGQMPAYLRALHALTACSGLPTYLAHHEVQIVGGRADGEEALRLFLTTIFNDSVDFLLDLQRFEHAYAELERLVFAGQTVTTVVAAVRGLKLRSEHIDLGGGLMLLAPDACDDLPPSLNCGDGAVAIARVDWESPVLDAVSLAHAHVTLRRLFIGLQLYDAAVIQMMPTAYTRIDDRAWRSLALDGGGPVRGVCVVPCEQEDELRAFLSLVARRWPRGGFIAWALERFSRACREADPVVALTDTLLALRALLEPEGPHSGLLVGRVAMLCAIAEQRSAVRKRVGRMVALERSLTTGLVTADAIDRESIDELIGWLRALLRDVLCGHLDADPRAAADRLLVEEYARQHTNI